MPLISRSIPNLVNGVSQQPASLRLDSQCEIQENGYSSVVEGLKKRPPTRNLAKLIAGTLAGTAHVHLINRDAVERYSVITTDGMIQVFDLTGVAKTINTFDETVVLLSGVASVINGVTEKVYKATGETAFDFVVSGIGTATVKLQGSVNGTDWTDLDTRTTNGTTVGVTIGSNIFMRAIVSAWTSGTITASVVYKHFRYLGATDPRASFRMVTVADFTFIVNNTVITKMASTLTTAAVSRGLVYIRQGNFSTIYKIFVDDVEKASYTTADATLSDIRTDNIAEQLRGQLVTNLGGGWTIAREGSTVSILKDNVTSFKLRCTDSNGDRNTVVVKEQIQRFSDLPNVAPNAFKLKITGDPGANADDYYVEFVVQDAGTTFGRGIWKEGVAPGISFAFDTATMPHSLSRQPDGSFNFAVSTWSGRDVGDEDSIPQPSFIGSTLNDVFFYRNRLGFCADENVILSRTGEYFIFWRRTATALLDDDVIDVAVPHTKVSILRHAVAASKKLIVFSDLTQFVAKHGDLLTPKTIGFDQTTEFENSAVARPVAVGKNLYFAVPKGGFSGVREYFVDQTTDADDAADVTSHVPAYIPANVTKIAAATNEDLLVVLSADKPSSIFAYKFYWSGNEKLQSSWSEWTFGTGEKVLDAGFIDTSLFLVMQREDGVYLEVMGVEPARKDVGFDHEVLIDRRLTAASSVVFNSTTGNTTWTLPYAESESMQIITRPGGSLPNGTALDIIQATTTTITAIGDFTAQPVYLGKKYIKKYRFSKPILKSKSSSGAETPITTGRLQVGTYTLNFSSTGYFRVEVTPEFNTTFVYAFTGRVIGAGSNIIGQPALHTGSFRFPVRSKNDRVTIDLINDSFLPSLIQSAEWEALYVTRSQRF